MAVQDVYKVFQDANPTRAGKRETVFNQVVADFAAGADVAGIDDPDKFFMPMPSSAAAFVQNKLNVFETQTKLTVHRGVLMTLVRKASLPPDPVLPPNP